MQKAIEIARQDVQVSKPHFQYLEAGLRMVQDAMF
jgi:hypothetical protein